MHQLTLLDCFLLINGFGIFIVVLGKGIHDDSKNNVQEEEGSDNDEKDTEIARIFDHIQLLQKKVESLEQYILHHMINTSETHADDVLAIAPENGGGTSSRPV